MTKHFVILGNGVAGTEAAFTIRKRLRPKEAKITLISDESPYFFSRTALMYAYMNRMKRHELEPFERKVYDRQKIERKLDRVIGLNGESKQLTLKSGEVLSYDKLLLAVGAAPRMGPFPGAEAVKEGLVHFVSIQDLDRCEALTYSTTEATVVGGGLIGVELAECFHHHKIKVHFLIREPYFWPAALGSEEGELITAHIAAHGIDITHNEELTQIETDASGRVSAIETSKGRRFPSQMLGICIGVVPQVSWLQETDAALEINQGILVDQSLRTSIPDVFAAGDCAEIKKEDGSTFHETIWYTARDQGRLAARSMLGDPVSYEAPTFYNSSKFFEIEYTTVGQVKDLPAGGGSLFRKHPKKDITQRILFSPDREVLGFSMLGSRWDHRLLIQWIEERRSLDYVRDHLRQAQFDHEFGRAPLGAMDEVETSL